MNLIVLDLEWNQCPDGKENRNDAIPFEIIEIGAVKLDAKFRVIGTFTEVIHPGVYDQIHHRTKEIVHLEMKDLENGRDFAEAVSSFIHWCGTNYRFCTWGTMDLTELQRNMQYYGIGDKLGKTIYYYDIQKLFSISFEDGVTKRTLEHAVDYLQLNKDIAFHRALYDAFYTVEIIRKLDWEKSRQHLSVDYYHTPESRKDEIYLRLDNSTKYISREFEKKEEVMKDRTVSGIKCPLCNARSKKKIRWFTGNTKMYECAAYCEKHGYLKGKIRIKKNGRGSYFAVKTIKPITASDLKKLEERREQISLKKREKRKKKNNKTEGV